jgi:hypothetical protein
VLYITECECSKKWQDCACGLEKRKKEKKRLLYNIKEGAREAIKKKRQIS